MSLAAAYLDDWRALLLPDWQSWGRKSPLARLACVEMLLAAPSSPPGYWEDWPGWMNDRLGVGREESLALARSDLADLVLLAPDGRRAWSARVFSRHILARRPTVEDVALWRASVAAIEDGAFRDAVLTGAGAGLEAIGRSGPLLRAWLGSSKKRGEGGSKAGSDGVSWVVDLYHEVLPGLPRVLCLTDRRQALIRARLAELARGVYGHCEPGQEAQWMRSLFERVARSPFLMGDSGTWRADLEWLMLPRNLTKVVEGRYDPEGAHQGGCAQFSAAFRAFMQAYPDRREVARAWALWRRMGLEESASAVMACLRSDLMRPEMRRKAPPAWRYLEDRPWELGCAAAQPNGQKAAEEGDVASFLF